VTAAAPGEQVQRTVTPFPEAWPVSQHAEGRWERQAQQPPPWPRAQQLAEACGAWTWVPRTSVTGP